MYPYICLTHALGNRAEAQWLADTLAAYGFRCHTLHEASDPSSRATVLSDAALVLADYVGGGISGFADKMNAKAAELGCESTHFSNPHGLFNPEHYTTARDMAKIANLSRSYYSNRFSVQIKTRKTV